MFILDIVGVQIYFIECSRPWFSLRDSWSQSKGYPFPWASRPFTQRVLLNTTRPKACWTPNIQCSVWARSTGNLRWDQLFPLSLHNRALSVESVRFPSPSAETGKGCIVSVNWNPLRQVDVQMRLDPETQIGPTGLPFSPSRFSALCLYCWRHTTWLRLLPSTSRVTLFLLPAIPAKRKWLSFSNKSPRLDVIGLAQSWVYHLNQSGVGGAEGRNVLIGQAYVTWPLLDVWRRGSLSDDMN